MTDLISALFEDNRFRIAKRGQDAQSGILAFDSNWPNFPSIVIQGTLTLANLLNPVTVPFGVNLGFFPVTIFREMVSVSETQKQLHPRSLNQYPFTFRWTAGGSSSTVTANVLCPHYNVEIKRDRLIVNPVTPIQVSDWYFNDYAGRSPSALHAKHSQPISFRYMVLDIPALII